MRPYKVCKHDNTPILIGISLFLTLPSLIWAELLIAGVKLNGKDCGIAWTPPYQVEITNDLKIGKIYLEVRVANTWLNRLMGDGTRIEMGAEKHTGTTCNPFTVDPELTVSEISAEFYHKDTKPEPASAGLLGPVRILVQ